MKVHLIITVAVGMIVSCDGCSNLGETNLTASENPQYLTSPNYPMVYDNNLNCQWAIRCINGTGHLHLKFTFFRTRTMADYLLVYDGVIGEEHLLGKLYGTETNRIFNPNSTSVFLRFRTNSALVSQGFRLRYLCVDSLVDHCQGMPCLNGATCQNDLHNYTCICYQRFSGQNCSQGCGRTPVVLNATRGYQYLTSQNYPNKYPNRVSCNWIITCSFGRIYINVMHLATELRFDQLKIYDGVAPSYLTNVASLSGYKNDSIYGFNSRNVYLRFTSDSSGARSGFRLKFHCADNTTDPCQQGVCLNGASCYNRITNYTCICKTGITGNNCEITGCNGDIYANWTMGTINSTNYPRNYDRSMNCSWKLVCPGEQIKIRVVRLETESCCDYLTIDSGNGNARRLRGTVRNLVLHYNRSSLRFNFISDSFLSRRGFNLEYLCLESQSICDNNPCQNGANCSGNRLNYICTCARGFTGKNCSINIDDCSGYRCRNGGTCIDLVDDYKCSCLPGFSGRRCSIRCAANLLINANWTVGTINSKNYPGRYDRSMNCSWNLVCPGEQIDVWVVSLDTNSCCDYLTIDSGNGNVTKLKGFVRNLVLHYNRPSLRFNFISGTYRPRTGFNLEYLCLDSQSLCDNNPCQNGANCSGNRLDYICACPRGFTGKNCSINIDDCSGYWCRNGGTCIDLVDDYKCSCRPGFGGRRCTGTCYGLQYLNATFNEQRLTSLNYPDNYRNLRNCTWQVMCPANMKVSIRVARLRTEPCCDFLYIYQDRLTRLSRIASLSGYKYVERFVTNGSVAYIHFETDSSSNRDGFDLTYKCENTMCEFNPCLYGSQCISSGSNYTCNCTKGYEGRNCSKVVEKCLAKPCSRGACVDRPNDYYCECPAGYVGKNCSLDVDECALGYCKNGAFCSDLINNYQCFCASGFKGRNCETEINKCRNNPCYNNANCTSLVDAFNCTCAPGYTSNLCEVEINECDSNPCKNEGVCQDMIDDFKCVCPPGRKGKDCGSGGIALRSPGVMLVLICTLFIMLVQRSH